jgi:hypothetical protein
MSKKRDDDPEALRARDLVRSGEIGETAHNAERFGQGVVDRFLRRPVGNSERLWRRIDGTDPWDNSPPPPVEKPRGVYAAGRLVRLDKPAASTPQDSVPDWARKAQADRDAARASPKAEAAPAAKAEKIDPMDKLKQAISERQAAADAETARKQAETRAAMAKAPPRAEEPPPASPPATRTPRSTLTKAGRIRTGDGGSTAPVPPPALTEKAPPPQPSQRAYAAGRAPPPPKARPKDIPIEQRMPPRIDPNSASKAKAAPVQHAYAAGRAPPPPKAAAKDLPVEMRKPPKPGGAPEPTATPAAPAAPPRPAGPAGKPPVESHQPPDVRPTPPASANPHVAGGLPGQPAPAPKSASNKASMDDIFGMAAQEGRVRVGRRSKPAAEATPADAPAIDPAAQPPVASKDK